MANVLECYIVRIDTPLELKYSSKFEAASPMGVRIAVSDYCGFAHTTTFIPDYVKFQDSNACVLTDALVILTNMDEFTKLIKRLTLVDYDPFEEFTKFTINGYEYEDAHEGILNTEPVKAIVQSILEERSSVIFD